MSLPTYVPGQSLGFCLLACFILFLISVVSQKVISHWIFQFRLGKDSPGVMQAYLWLSRKGHIFFYHIIFYWSFGNFTSCSTIPLTFQSLHIHLLFLQHPPKGNHPLKLIKNKQQWKKPQLDLLSFPLFQHLSIHPSGIRSSGVSGSDPFV